VFKTLVTAVVIGAASSGAAIAQTALNTNVPRSNYIATMDGEFRKMDADKNGQVTRVEVEAFDRGAAVANARARAQATFNQLDADRNGQLNQAEFNRIVTGTPAVDGRPLINALDTNKDGRISLIEHRAGKLNRFDQIDLDKDGVVSAAEMKTAGVIK
jgi:Ca2+-binding EF-hand superfamily protein